MNWNKALNLLIVMFIIVNVVLGVANYNKNVKAYKLSDKQVDTIVSLLEDRGVILDCELPISFKPTASIWIEPVDLAINTRDNFVKNFLNEDLSKVMITKENTKEGQQLVYKYEGKQLRFVGKEVGVRNDSYGTSEISLSNEVYYINENIQQNAVKASEKELLAIAEEFFNKLPMEETYKNVKIKHKIESYGAEVTYYELYKGFPLFNSYVKMHVTPEGVYSAEMRLIEQCDTVEGARQLYPINRVLFELVGDFDSEEDVRITDIELGYMIPSVNRPHLLEEEAIPVYKIEITGLNEPLFVNAYTNELVEE